MEKAIETKETDNEKWFRIHVWDIELEEEKAQDMVREYFEEKTNLDASDWWEEVHRVSTHHNKPDLITSIEVDFQPRSWHE